MRNLDPTIKRQEIIRTQLWNALQGDIIGNIRYIVDGPRIEFNQRTDVASNAIQVTISVMPELYSLLESVKFNLDFKDDIELYVKSDSEVNAFSYTSHDGNKAHIIVMTSALVNIFDDDELAYIIGHEIGHIINLDRDINLLYDFIYNDGDDDWQDNVPLPIRIRYKEYEQLAEYAADRYGYLGCTNENACISAIYKLSAGIDLKKMNVDFDALYEQNWENLNFLMDLEVICTASHPMNPFRIQALVEFANCKTQKALEEKMELLFTAIPHVSHTDTDTDVATFLAAAGLKIAMADGKIDKSERDLIIDEMAIYVLEATKLLKQVQRKNVDDVICELLPKIKEEVPEKLEGILKFIINISFGDHVISQNEVDTILEFGHKFDMDDAEIYSSIADYIKNGYYHLSEGL